MVQTGTESPRIVAGRYRLDGLIASGGMAEVWRAHDDLLDRQVAVKVPLGPLRRKPEFMERFRREAVAAARLNHPRVVRVYDTGSDPEIGAFIVMELVEGPSLKALMAERRLSTERAVEITADVAQALDFAHRSGVVHRDIKPANVLVAADGPKVADFGIAKGGARSSDMTETGITLGTARYLSPEQVEGKALDARSDLYSLGVVLYEMLCGQAPFDADTDLALALKHVTANAPQPTLCDPSLPDWLDEVVMKALAKDPDERYASAAEFRRALLARVPTRSAPAVPPPPGTAVPTRPAGPARRPVTASADTTTALATGSLARVDGADGIWPAPAPAGPGADPGAGPAGTNRYRLLGALGAAIVVVAAGVGLVSARLGDNGHKAGSSTAVTAPGQSSVQIPVAAAHSFNPPPGSGSEHEELVANLIDGNPSTYWHTHQYANASFGNLKDGTGVYLQLRSATKLGDLVISSPDTGWSFQVYESNSDPTSLAGWGTSVAHGTVGAASTSVGLGGQKTGYVLLWITHLPASDQVRIGELSLFS